MSLRPTLLASFVLSVASIHGCNWSADDSVTLEYAKRPLTQAGVTSTLSIDDDWGTGFCASVSVVNKGNRPVRSWRLVMQRNGADIGRKWTGLNVDAFNRVIVMPEDSNATIPVGGTVSVPFCGSGKGRPTLESMSVEASEA